MEREKRTAVIRKSAIIKVNTGNFENLEICQCIEAEVEYADLAELKQKNASMTQVLGTLLKESAEQTLKATNRRRVVNNQPAELW